MCILSISKICRYSVLLFTKKGELVSVLAIAFKYNSIFALHLQNIYIAQRQQGITPLQLFAILYVCINGTYKCIYFETNHKKNMQ